MSDKPKVSVKKYSEEWRAQKLKAREQLDSGVWQKSRKAEKEKKVGTSA